MSNGIVRRVVQSEVKSVNTKDFTVEVVMSDETVDRYREVIKVGAWKKRLASYKKHPVLLSSHNYSGLMNQIGEAKRIEVKDGALRAEFQYYVEEGVRNPEAEWAWVLASKGIAAFSVGFINHGGFFVEDGDPPKGVSEEEYSFYKKQGVRYVYTDVELMECSQVVVPANPSCLQDQYERGAVIKSLGERAYAALSDLENELKCVRGKNKTESKGVIPYAQYPLADKDTPWDGPAEVTKASVDDLKVMCTWYAEKGENKGDYKLPHHMAEGHATVWRGVANAAARLSKTQIPAEDMPGVKRHLAKHYEEFDEIPPWKKSAELWEKYCEEDVTEEEFECLFDKGIISEDLLLEFKKWEETENEIRCRLKDPALFEKFRYVTLKADKPRVRGILGKLKNEGNEWDLQALRFPKQDGWTLSEAKKWVKEHPDISKTMDKEGIVMNIDDFEETIDSLKEKLCETFENQMKICIETIVSSIRSATDEIVMKALESLDEELEKRKEKEMKEVVGEEKKEEVSEDTTELLNVFRSITEEMKQTFGVQS
jgi:hypothetical protein